MVMHGYHSGFWCLAKPGCLTHLCQGRYGQEEDMLYRLEEIRKTPWVQNRVPANDTLGASSSR